MSTKYRDSIEYGQAANALWHAYQAMQARQATTAGKREGAWMILNASGRNGYDATAGEMAIINHLDRAYRRQGNATARLFKAYADTFERAPYHNSVQSDVTLPSRYASPVGGAALAFRDAPAILAEAARVRDATRDQSRDLPDSPDPFGQFDMPLSAGMVGF